MDNAKHFKNKELVYHFCEFFEKTFKRRVQISWNFFIKKKHHYFDLKKDEIKKPT
jgi:hypothetical protein